MKIKVAKISFSAHKCDIAGRVSFRRTARMERICWDGIIFIGLIVIDGRMIKRFSVSKLLKEVV